MKLIADVHLHSHYSRATSKDLDFEHLAQWAQRKGVHIVGTGDIAHPGWLAEMRAKLEPAEEGLFRLKDEVARAVQKEVPAACQGTVRFMLAGEISSIYKKHDQVRKVHNVIFAPSLDAVEKLQFALEKIGNIRADGRPILGLPSRDLLEIILEIDPQCYLIPAHIWTPWFSLLGSKSGYDSLEECFEDLSDQIFAVETGLSSDPPMNWRVSWLDKYTLVSNSDAHSPQKLAREATVFDTELSYSALFHALQTGDPTHFRGTIEFFPEEGKYHFDGHRKCQIRWTPQTTIAHNGLCTVCGKPVTIGVTHRVEELADREEGAAPARMHPYQCLIPLPEILAEVYDVGASSKRVQGEYESLLTKLGSELTILQDAPLDEIERAGGPLLAEGIRRVRTGEVAIAAGYDGEYGVIKLFDQHERKSLNSQPGLFGQLSIEPLQEQGPQISTDQCRDSKSEKKAKLHNGVAQTIHQTPLSNPFPLTAREQPSRYVTDTQSASAQSAPENPLTAPLNPQQRAAVLCTDRPLSITAGPGTGKTRVLTVRIAHLILDKGITPASILAITFTNKAADEMRTRLIALLGEQIASRITIKTFHAFGAQILHEAGARIGLTEPFAILNERERIALLRRACPELSQRESAAYLERISEAKNRLRLPDAPGFNAGDDEDAQFLRVFRAYEALLHKNNLIDFDDLILRPIQLFQLHPDVQIAYQQRFRWIAVDEYQDVNLAQYRLLRLLTHDETNLCVIGDPDQAIYGFRGADRGYFLRFQQDFPHAVSLHLTQNYRSTQLILDASTHVIGRDHRPDRLAIWSDFLDKTKLDVHQAATDKAEAEYVVHQIERMVGGTSYFSLDSGRVDDDGLDGRAFADFAVLYRLSAQSSDLIEAFDRSGIPYQSVGQTPLTDHQEIRTILAHLWFVYSPHALPHLEQILNAGGTLFQGAALDRLVSWAHERSITLWDALQTNPLHWISNAAQEARVADVVSLVRQLHAARATQPVTALISLVRDFIWLDEGDLSPAQSARVEQLLRRAHPFADALGDFLEASALQRETDFYDPRADRVTLLSLHASKGLEFPVVFIVGCEEGLLPYARAEEEGNVDEERRLFYVGMTRAQQKLVLTHARSRLLFGQRMENPQSRFVDDIEVTLKEMRAAERRTSPKETPEMVQLRLF